MALNTNEPQTRPVLDSSGGKSNLVVASNFSRLKPEEQRAVNWHVDLQFEKAVKSGNTWAAANKDEFIQNGRESMATNNEAGLRETVARFNDPISKARAEAEATQLESLPMEHVERSLRSPNIQKPQRAKGSIEL